MKIVKIKNILMPQAARQTRCISTHLWQKIYNGVSIGVGFGLPRCKALSKEEMS
jgi:hypothetical protein